MASPNDIKAGRAFVEVSADIRNLAGGLRKASRRIKAFAQTVKSFGFGLLKTAALFGAPLVVGTKVFADFEQQMANVATMLDNPEANMKRFREGVREMSVEFGETTEALAGGLFDILSASVDASKALDVLEVSVRSARAGLTDTKTAADAITTVLNAYRLSADQAASVSDFLFGIVKRGKLTFGQIAANIGKVATTAAAAGITLEELGGIIGLLTRVGVKTEEAITSIVAVISSFLKPGDEAAKVAKDLGFEMNSATLQAEGLLGVFRRIENLPPETLVKLFPNVSALKAVLPALQNVKAFADDVEGLRNRAGATQRAYAIMADTLSQSFRKIQQAALVVFSRIGEAIAEPVGQAAAFIVDIIQKVDRLVRKNKSLIVAFAKVTVVLGAVGALFVSFGISLGLAAFAVNGFAAAFAALAGVLAFTGKAIAVLAAPLVLLKAALVGVMVAVFALSGAFDEGIKFIGQQLQTLKAFTVNALGGIRDALLAGDIKLAARILWLSLKTIWQRGIFELNFLWESWVFGISDAWDVVVTGATNSLDFLFVTIKNALSRIGQLFLKLGDFISKIFFAATERILGAFDTLLKGIGKVGFALRVLSDADVAALSRARQALSGISEQQRSRAREFFSGEIASNEEERQRRLGTFEDRRNRRNVELGQNRQERERAFQTDIQKAEAELLQARREFDAAITQAAKQRAASEVEGQKVAGAATARQRLEDAQATVTQARKSVGQFQQIDLSRIILTALSGGEVQRVNDPQLRETNKQLTEIVKNTAGPTIPVAG